MDFLESKNQNGNLSFVDINSSDFSFESKYGITYKEAMERIIAIRNDGSIIKDISIFQESYNLIGLGWVYAPTKLPIIDKLVGFIYKLWAKYRLKLTLRPSIEKLCDSKGFDCQKLK